MKGRMMNMAMMKREHEVIRNAFGYFRYTAFGYVSANGSGGNSHHHWPDIVCGWEG